MGLAAHPPLGLTEEAPDLTLTIPALRLPAPFVSIRTLTADAAARQGLPLVPRPAAYVCVGETCSAPILRAADLRAGYEERTKLNQYQQPQTPTATE